MYYFATCFRSQNRTLVIFSGGGPSRSRKTKTINAAPIKTCSFSSLFSWRQSHFGPKPALKSSVVASTADHNSWPKGAPDVVIANWFALPLAIRRRQIVFDASEAPFSFPHGSFLTTLISPHCGAGLRGMNLRPALLLSVRVALSKPAEAPACCLYANAPRQRTMAFQGRRSVPGRPCFDSLGRPSYNLCINNRWLILQPEQPSVAVRSPAVSKSRASGSERRRSMRHEQH